VKRVVDGDTIALENGQKVRYLNVDTPETVAPNTPVQCFGPEASEFNKKLVKGQSVWLVSDQENKDRYGRWLRFVFTSSEVGNLEESVNAKLVKGGYAKVSIYKPNDTYEEEFYQWQQEAQEKEKGLWGECE
jgi:micrococcal nuclease